MIVVVAALALQSAAPDTLVVKDANHAVRIPLVDTRAGPMLPATSLSPVVTVVVRQSTPDEYAVRVNGTTVRVWPGLRYVAIGERWHQLSAAPQVEARQLLVPLQFVAEVVPPLIRSGVLWDAERSELRLFSRVASRVAPRRDSASTPRTPRRSAPAAPRWRVVVDAGHGGPDNGMTGPLGGGGPTIVEKDITLQIARQLGAQLRARGIAVVYTRTRDTLIALTDRGRIANEANADLFLSIHVNAAPLTWRSPAAARGFETYFLAEAKTDDARRVEEMENESVRFETTSATSKGDALSFIVADMLQNQHLRESSELAEMIQRRLAGSHPGPDRGVKQAGFRVLVTAFMPSVLIEVGFGTNASEARYLASPSGQREVATAIAAATRDYLNRYERRVTGAADRGER